MGAMGNREPNRARWIGVRPGHDGTQLLAYTAGDDGTHDVYEVPAGKVLYLVEVTTSFRNTAGAVGLGYSTLDSGAGTVYMLALFKGADDTGFPHSNNFNPPIECPAGYKIKITSDINNMRVYCSVFGWLETL